MGPISYNKAAEAAKQLEVNRQSEKSPKPKAWWGTRHTFTAMALLGFSCLHNMRVNLSIAIVAMVNGTNPTSGNDSTYGYECREEWHVTPTQTHGEFNWDSQTQGLLLSSFYYGFMVLQIPGGLIAERYGGKRVFLISTFLASLISCLNPMIARLGANFLVASRAIQGLVEAPVFPCLYAMGSQWLPVTEKSFLMSIILAGTTIGACFSMLVNGMLASTYGWEWAFYVPGMLGFSWCLIWTFLCFDSPESHPRISEEERNYIIDNKPKRTDGKSLIPPVKSILTSKPFLAICAANFAQNYGFFTLMTGIPSYLSNIQHFSMEQNGTLSALPYILMTTVSLTSGFVSDRLINSGRVSKTVIRKVFTGVGHLGASAGLVFLCFVGCDRTQAIVALCIAVGLNGCAFSGVMQNNPDIGPNFAGTLSGTSNTIGTLGSFLPPLVTGMLTKDHTIAQWRTVFLLTVGIYVAGNIIYFLFASGEVQPWNDPDFSAKVEKKKKIQQDFQNV